MQWRQQQRGPQARPRLILLEAGDGNEDGEGSESGADGSKDPSANGGARQLLAALGMGTSGILERDREDAWDATD